MSSLPDAPTNEPVEYGQSDAKKPKLSAETDDEWETVEKTELSATNGLEDQAFLQKDKPRSTSIDEDVMSQETKEQQAAALHTAQTGGDPPQNALERDW